MSSIAITRFVITDVGITSIAIPSVVIISAVAVQCLCSNADLVLYKQIGAM